MKTMHTRPSLLFRTTCMLFALLISAATLAHPQLLQAAQIRYVSYISAVMYQSTGKINFKSPDIEDAATYIEVGAKGLNVGDLILCQKVTTKNYIDYFSAYMTFSQTKNVIYKSSNPAVASVNKNGAVTLKKPGDVCIAIKQKQDIHDKTYYFPLHVMKKNAKLETKLSNFDAYRKAEAASIKACKAFLAGVNPKLTIKNVAKQYKLYQTFEKKNPSYSCGLISPHEQIVPGKYWDEAAAAAPKTYQKKYSYTGQLTFEFGLSLDVNQCDVYQIDSCTYRIVPDYYFQPVTAVMLNLQDAKGESYDGEYIVADDSNARIAALDAKTQTLTVRPEYADAVADSLTHQASTFSFEQKQEKFEMTSYDLIYDASILKANSYRHIMESQFSLWDPMLIEANHMLEIKSIKTGLTSGTITLKNKITTEQLMGINFAKKGVFQAKDITITAYLVNLNGPYGVQLMKPIPIKMTFKKGSSKIQMKYSKKLQKFQDYILSDTTEPPTISWLYDGEQYVSFTPL